MSALAGTLREAAKLMRKRATEATSGPWERPLDTRYKNVVIAALPEDEEPRSWKGGVIPADLADQKGPMGRYAGQRERVGVVSASAGMDGFARKRNGRDLEYIAGMHPGVALAVADWLDSVGGAMADELYEATADGDCCGTPGACSGHPGVMTCNKCAEPFPEYCHCWDAPVKVARAYLGGDE